MKIVGFALLLVGFLALVYGGIGYNRRTTFLDVGGIQATATEHKSIPVAPIVGGVALIGGIMLLGLPRRRLV